VQLQAFVSFALDGSEWVAAGSGRFTPREPQSRSGSSSKKKTVRLPRIEHRISGRAVHSLVTTLTELPGSLLLVTVHGFTALIYLDL
jgi:hypothetical protein